MRRGNALRLKAGIVPFPLRAEKASAEKGIARQRGGRKQRRPIVPQSSAVIVRELVKRADRRDRTRGQGKEFE